MSRYCLTEDNAKDAAIYTIMLAVFTVIVSGILVFALRNR